VDVRPVPAWTAACWFGIRLEDAYHSKYASCLQVARRPHSVLDVKTYTNLNNECIPPMIALYALFS
jgi:hypothetical protein